MASSFLGLYVQRDALQIAQKALDITGHNITNIKTDGYSRQRVDIVSVANKSGVLGYNTSISLAGKGAEAIGVTQARDKLLDAKVRKYTSELSERGAKTSVLGEIEDVLDDIENQDAGLSAIFGNFKTAFQDFSATGADRQDLANVAKNKAESVVNVLKNFDVRLNEVEKSVRQDIEYSTVKIDGILRDIGNLNKQIKDSYVQMNDVFATPNDYQAEVQYGPLELKDKINLLCDELSQYFPVKVTEEKNGTYSVSLISACGMDHELVKEDKYAKVDWQFSDEQPEKNDFAEYYISNLNNEKEWKKCLREVTEQVRVVSQGQPEDDNLEIAINKLNTLIFDGRAKEAEEFERTEIKRLVDMFHVDYDPICKANAADFGKLPDDLPSYAIENTSISQDLDSGDINSGAIKGLFDMYNGKGCYALGGENSYRGVKYYQETILAFAKTMVRDFNNIYKEYNDNNPGNEFYLFEFNGLDPSVNPYAQGDLPRVSDLQIAQTWEDNSIRCVHPLVDPASGEPIYNYDQLDNTYLNKLLATFDNKRDFGREPEDYTFENFIKNYDDNVGAQLEYELGSFDSAEIMYKSVSEAREEVMGVSMGEEGTNMMNYQKWYNAISRMINALDECLDKLINGTGLVGR